MQTYPWQQHYPSSVPFQINAEQYNSLVDFLEESLEKYKNLPMVENMGKILSYADIDRLTRAFAAYLQHHTDLRPGDRIAIQLPNLLQYPIAMLGAIRAGMVIVNINPLYTPYEMEQQLKDAAVKGIVILSNFAHNLASIIANTSIKTVIITEIGDLFNRFKRHIVNFTIKHIRKLVPYYKFSKNLSVTNFNHIIKLGERSAFGKVFISPTQPAFIQYTGGTTGVSKGVILTHRNMLANIQQILTFMRIKLQEGKEIYVTPLPLYHIFALTVNLLAPIHLGAKNVLITNPRDIGGFIKELCKHATSCISGVNTLFNSLMEHPKFSSIDFSSLKISVAGGVALQDAVAEKWEKLTGLPLIEGYGLTEASPCITCNIPNGTHRRGTVGVPIPGTSIKIVDDTYQEVPTEVAGQLLVKGPQVMEAYWNNAAETEQVFIEGWLQTGDIATISADGYLKILDRKKEMINVSGFNVYPNEIENIVLMHPKVLEAAAVGILEEGSKEAVKLFVVKRDLSLTVEELIIYCRTHLTNYKVPRYIEFRESLPKSNVGKVLRRVLQEEEKQKQFSE